MNKIAGTEEVGCQSTTDFNVLNLVFCVFQTITRDTTWGKHAAAAL